MLEEVRNLSGVSFFKAQISIMKALSHDTPDLIGSPNDLLPNPITLGMRWSWGILVGYKHSVHLGIIFC